MNLPVIAALLVSLAALLRLRKLEKQLAVERGCFDLLVKSNMNDYQREIRLAEKHDRLLGEKNNLLVANEALRAELRRRHRKVRGV